MTGRDLIMYILQNHLEDEPVILDGGFLNLLSEEAAAVKFNVGTATIRTWYSRGLVEGIMVGDNLYILPESEPPVKLSKKDEQWYKGRLSRLRGIRYYK